MNPPKTKKAAKYWWNQCISCSEAAMTTQLRSFDIEEPSYEQAIHTFSGGFMHSGQACGLLTGTALAVGVITQKKIQAEELSTYTALNITIQLAKAHPELIGSLNCHEITKVSLKKLAGVLNIYCKAKAIYAADIT